MIQEKLETLSSEEESMNFQASKPKCTSRLLWLQNTKTEMDNWTTEISAEVNKKTEDLIKRKEKLSEKLEEILQSIPSCVQVAFS